MNAENINLFAMNGSIQTSPNVEPRIANALREVYAEISRMPLFPSGECISSSINLFFKHGFNIQGGWFTVDYPTDPNLLKDRFKTHFWSVNESTIYDLTLAQFNLLLIDPVPKGIIIAEMGSKLWQRYIYPDNPLVDQLGLERPL